MEVEREVLIQILRNQHNLMLLSFSLRGIKELDHHHKDYFSDAMVVTNELIVKLEKKSKEGNHGTSSEPGD